MRIAELQNKILTDMKYKLSDKDLINLSLFNEVWLSGLKPNMHDKLEIFIRDQSYAKLVMIHTKVNEYINNGKRVPSSVIQITDERIKCDNELFNYQADTLSDEMIERAPINLKKEVSMIDCNSIVVVDFTKYDSEVTSVPMTLSTGGKKRMPNMLPYMVVQDSPFYCCPVCLHPLSMLIPTRMPNYKKGNRIMSSFTFQFCLSDEAITIIMENCQNVNSKKVDYKWQVLLKFIDLKTNMTLPSPGQLLMQTMPPYLELKVNGNLVLLWEILPSNCRTKEGKRHPKPVNITDNLNFKDRNKNGYPQTIVVSWWQTPSVFQYYYMGVYIERKLSVCEIVDLLSSKRHINIRPIEYTLKLIKLKLSDRKYGNNDDIIVSSCLPISLSCPVGRSRIEIPVRALKCKHLQCFDAKQFMAMNERRSLWKCPVCDISATFNELFCDKYFQKILQHFIDKEDVNDVNVNSDGTYIAVFKRREDNVVRTTHDENQVPGIVDIMIILDSDDEEDGMGDSNKISDKGPLSNRDSSIKSIDDSEKHSTTLSLFDHQLKELMSAQPMVSIFQKTDQIQTSYSFPTNRMPPIDQYMDQSSFKSIYATTATLSPVSHINSVHASQMPYLCSAPFMPVNNIHSSFSVPPPLYTPTEMAAQISMAAIQSINPFDFTYPPPFSTFASMPIPMQMLPHGVIPAPSKSFFPVQCPISSVILAPIAEQMIIEPPSTCSSQLEGDFSLLRRGRMLNRERQQQYRARQNVSVTELLHSDAFC